MKRGELPEGDCRGIQVVVIADGVCVACDEPLDRSDGGVKCQVGDRSFVLHAQCYVAWQELLPERRPMVGWQQHPKQGVSQPPMH